MRVGIGLPSMLHGVEADAVLAWARAADQTPLSTLSTGELVCTPSYDALTVLSAVGVVTTRIRLMTNVLVLPLHRAGLVAKQAATIAALTGGRLTLGIGIGGRKPVLFGITGDAAAHANYPDFAAAPAPYAGRGQALAGQLALMRRIWAGEPPLPGVPPVGPRLAAGSEPEILVGGYDGSAIRRAATLAEGLTIFDHAPDAGRVATSFELARRAWSDLGRHGDPRLVASTYFALGPEALEGKERFLATHYGHLSADGRAAIGRSIALTDETALRTCLADFDALGTDEVLFVPMVPAADQVARLADVL